VYILGTIAITHGRLLEVLLMLLLFCDSSTLSFDDAFNSDPYDATDLKNK
jgi:hypothetical protein